MRYDTVRLVLAHAIMLGHKVEGEYEHQPSDITSMGFFDSSAPNYMAFDPSVDKDSFTPKDEDFIYPTFRLLSETIVHKGWNPIDFSAKGVLKKSMAMMQNQVIYPDHEKLVANGMGVVNNVKWQSAYKLDGKEIPAGMVGELKIDGKANPRIARLMLMNPPGIHSVSATVQFAWEKSHNLPDDEFYSKLGSFDEKGQMYRRVVTDITEFSELSLVPHGADPYAKMIADGKMVNPNILNKSLSADDPMVFDYTDIPEHKLNSISLSLKSNKSMKFTLSDAMKGLTEKLGITLPEDVNLEELTTEQFTEHVLGAIPEASTDPELPENLAAIQARFPNMTADGIATLEANQVTEDQTAILNQVAELGGAGTLTEAIQNATAQLTTLRDETLSNYNLSVGVDNSAEAIVGMINKSSVTVLQALNAGYKTSLEAGTPLHCTECGSENVSRETSSRDQGSKDKQSFMNRARSSKSMKASSIHSTAQKS